MSIFYGFLLGVWLGYISVIAFYVVVKVFLDL